MATTLTIKTPPLDLILDSDNKKLCDAISDMFASVPQGMTSFQIKNFVLCDKDFPTVDSKWWQAKLELWVRFQNVVHKSYDYRKKIAKNKEFTAKIEEYIDESKNVDKQYIKRQLDAKIELFNIKIEENEFNMSIIKKSANDVLKEIKVFLDEMQRLEPSLSYSTSDKDEQEENYWETKSKIDMNLTSKFPEVFNNQMCVQ